MFEHVEVGGGGAGRRRESLHVEVGDNFGAGLGGDLTGEIAVLAGIEEDGGGVAALEWCL